MRIKNIIDAISLSFFKCQKRSFKENSFKNYSSVEKMYRSITEVSCYPMFLHGNACSHVKPKIKKYSGTLNEGY